MFSLDFVSLQRLKYSKFLRVWVICKQSANSFYSFITKAVSGFILFSPLATAFTVFVKPADLNK
jgi:hypothetical protein